MSTNWSHAISCMGDSLTHNATMMVPVHQLWPASLQAKFRADTRKVVSRNFGKSGNTTTQMVTRFSCMTQFSIPDIGIVFGGVNDPGNTITQATTQANIESMIQTLKNAGCTRILVVSAQLLNYTSGGDIAAGVPKTDDVCNYATVIAAQKAAAASKSVVYCDLYNYLRARITGGQDAAASASWHVAGTDQHFNAYGHGLVAQKVYDTIKAQGWDASLI